MPVEHERDEQPPACADEAQQRATGQPGCAPRGNSGRRERERLPVLAPLRPPSLPRAYERARDEAAPGAEPEAAAAELGEGLPRPALAGGHGRRAITAA